MPLLGEPLSLLNDKDLRALVGFSLETVAAVLLLLLLRLAVALLEHRSLLHDSVVTVPRHGPVCRCFCIALGLIILVFSEIFNSCASCNTTLAQFSISCMSFRCASCGTDELLSSDAKELDFRKVISTDDLFSEVSCTVGLFTLYCAFSVDAEISFKLKLAFDESVIPFVKKVPFCVDLELLESDLLRFSLLCCSVMEIAGCGCLPGMCFSSREIVSCICRLVLCFDLPVVGLDC